jgi:hypothetical protein
MLVPLTREKFEQLIPLIATGPQYKYCWGKPQDVLKRLLISFVSVIILNLIIKKLIFGDNPIIFCLEIIAGLYWLWGPVYWASWRNMGYRKYPYSGFWRGEVLDRYLSEKLIGKEETVNDRGQLVVVENKERRLNIEVGDETGFTTTLQVPLQREHKAIALGQIAEMVVMSNEPDLSVISKVSDIYIPGYNLWISDYPYLRRDLFADASRRLKSYDDDPPDYPERRPRPRRPRKRR